MFVLQLFPGIKLNASFFSACKSNTDCPDNLTCEDDVCIEQPCPKDCDSNSICVTKNHTSSCNCMPGYSWDSGLGGCKGEQNHIFCKLAKMKLSFHKYYTMGHKHTCIYGWGRWGLPLPHQFISMKCIYGHKAGTKTKSFQKIRCGCIDNR